MYAAVSISDGGSDGTENLERKEKNFMNESILPPRSSSLLIFIQDTDST